MDSDLEEDLKNKLKKWEKDSKLVYEGKVAENDSTVTTWYLRVYKDSESPVRLTVQYFWESVSGGWMGSADLEEASLEKLFEWLVKNRDMIA